MIFMDYTDLLIEADCNQLIVKEKPLEAFDGRIKGNKIAIKKNLTTTEKKCVLAEELGHHYTTVGNILNQNCIQNRKQEQQARLWAYNKLIGLNGIINAYKYGCQNLAEISEYLEVSPTFLSDAIEKYRSKYGEFTTLDNYIIYFEPYLAVIEMY